MLVFCRSKNSGKLFIFLFVTLLVSGCAVMNSTGRPTEVSGLSGVYQSELSEPNAKALFAFSQFRLFGSENRWEEALSALNRAVEFDPDTVYLQLILAKAHLHTEQPDKAVQTLKGLLVRFPKNIEAYQLLGDVYSYQGNYVSAIECFRQALDLDPENEQLEMRLAMVLARLDKKSEAIKVLEALLKRHPEATVARLSLARFYSEKGLNDQANAAYQQILDQDPGQQNAALEYGKLLEQTDVDTAIEIYRNVLSHNPLAAAVRQRLAQIYLSREQLEKALEQFQAVRKQYPDNLQIVERIAFIHLELEHWAEAEAALRGMPEDSEHQDQNRYYLSMALSGQGKVEEALQVLEPVSKTSSIYPDAVLQRAYLNSRIGQNVQAVSVLRQALEEGFEQVDMYYYLAVFLGEQKEYEQAREVVLSGIENHPEDTRLLYQLGIADEKLGDRKAAVESMERILELDSDHADALNFLAYHQAEKGLDLDLALSRARKALKLKPSGYVVDTLGWILFKMGRFAESRVQLEEALRLQPEDAVIAEHLGDVYRELKLWREAGKVYRRALEIDPKAKHVEEKLRTLPPEDSL